MMEPFPITAPVPDLFPAPGTFAGTVSIGFAAPGTLKTAFMVGFFVIARDITGFVIPPSWVVRLSFFLYFFIIIDNGIDLHWFLLVMRCHISFPASLRLTPLTAILLVSVFGNKIFLTMTAYNDHDSSSLFYGNGNCICGGMLNSRRAAASNR
jgi:hypothetical protein